jgi:hypothetical protein
MQLEIATFINTLIFHPAYNILQQRNLSEQAVINREECMFDI